MKSLHSRPFYLLSPDSAIIGDNQLIIEAIAASPVPKLAMSVAPEVVDMGDVSGPTELILALQHYPQHLAKMQGTLHFDFEMTTGSDLFIPEEDWKLKAKYLRWFMAMRTLEFMPFFVKDKDVRLYMLAGDYLVKNKTLAIREQTDDGGIKYIIKGVHSPLLSKRLFECCKTFLLYCHNTGFNPHAAIESMLAGFSLPVHSADIYKEYRKDVMKYEKNYLIRPDTYRFMAA